jgi:Type VI secretion system VasI, EvfG, VC_A0118
VVKPSASSSRQAGYRADRPPLKLDNRTQISRGIQFGHLKLLPGYIKPACFALQPSLFSCCTLAYPRKQGINPMSFSINKKTHRTAATRLASRFRTFLLLCTCAAPTAYAATPPQPLSKWQVLPASSSEESLAISLRAENAVNGWMKSSVPTLTIQCSKKKASVYIETGMPLEVTPVDQQTVKIQHDEAKPFPQRWREITNATLAASARDSVLLIKQLARSRKFTLEFTPFNSAPAQAEFDVAGLEAYLPQFSRMCWE